MSTAVTVAARPANISRTSWALRVNRELVELEIESQGGPGGPGGSQCLSINGRIGGIAPIHGWYYPSTGRIHFLHNNVNSGITVRVFTGNLSDDAPAENLYMAGTMTVVNVGFGQFGEFNQGNQHGAVSRRPVGFRGAGTTAIRRR